MRRRRAIVASVLAACYPTTTRPAFRALPGSPTTEVQLEVPEATRAVALALYDDSIPVRRTEAKDGWLESDWFDPRTLHVTTARPLGPEVVKVRAWIDPTRPTYSNITIEAVYRPLADPSLPARMLDRSVSDSTPLAARIRDVMKALTTRYGPKIDTTLNAAATAAAGVGKKALQGGADSLSKRLPRAGLDSLRKRRMSAGSDSSARAPAGSDSLPATKPAPVDSAAAPRKPAPRDSTP